MNIDVGALRRAYGSYRGASFTTRAFIAARIDHRQTPCPHDVVPSRRP
jgi:hypothetical protein